MWIRDPVSKNPSVTLTLFVMGYIIALLKLTFSGVQFGSSFIMTQFTGTDFAAVVGALGGIYALRRMNDGKPDNPT